MFNYFYTIEINLHSNIMKLEFDKLINSSFKHINNLQFTSKKFTDEKECVDEIISEINGFCDKLSVRHDRDNLIIMTQPNPFIINENENSSEIALLTDDEKLFWQHNKLVLFAVFEDKNDEAFLFRFVLFMGDDQLNISDENSYEFLKSESPSKLLN